MELKKVTVDTVVDNKVASNSALIENKNFLNASCYPSNCGPDLPCGPECNPYLNCRPTEG